MSTTNLGRIGFVLRGEYNDSYNYQQLDVVTYGGCLYGAAAFIPAGQRPGEMDNWIKLLDDTGKLSSYFGSDNSGKILSVGNDGHIALIDAPRTGAVFS